MIIPLFGLGNKSRSVTVSAQRRINVYAELSADADKTAMAFYGMPGLRLFTSFGDTPVRGMIAVGEFLYAIHRGTFYEVTNAGVATARGAIQSLTGRVRMAFNGIQIGIVDGVSMYSYNTNRTAATITSITNVTTTATLKTSTAHGRYTGETITVSGATPAAYNGTFTVTVVDTTTLTYTMLSNPGAAASVVGAYVVASSFVKVTSGLFPNPFDITWQGHMFANAFQSSGFFQISAIDDGTTYDALDFASAESEPDNLVRVIADHGELVLFGTDTIEFWANNGDATFPYANQRGSEVEYGLAAPWSLVKYNDSLAGLMKNVMGQVQVMMLQGHAPTALNGNDLNFVNEINGYATVSDATAFSYLLGGHPFLQMNFPTAGKSWCYDAAAGDWFELQSGLSGARHRGEICVDFLNKPRVSDYENGNIYIIDDTVYADNGIPRPYEITSRHVFSNLDIMRNASIQIDFEVGVGLINGQGSDPQAMLQISRDNGNTWGNEIWRPIGKIGEYLRRVIWRRLGAGYDFVFKVRVTDPVKFVVAAANLKNGNDQ
jgi:hypothetical protein